MLYNEFIFGNDDYIDIRILELENKDIDSPNMYNIEIIIKLIINNGIEKIIDKICYNFIDFFNIIKDLCDGYPDFPWINSGSNSFKDVYGTSYKLELLFYIYRKVSPIFYIDDARTSPLFDNKLDKYALCNSLLDSSAIFFDTMDSLIKHIVDMYGYGSKQFFVCFNGDANTRDIFNKEAKNVGK